MAFAEDHAAPLLPGPRHTLQVPITTLELNAGSSSQGALINESSSSTLLAPIVGVPAKSAALQLDPLPHSRRLTPAAVERYQFLGLL
jgi:hypothetical protein